VAEHRRDDVHATPGSGDQRRNARSPWQWAGQIRRARQAEPDKYLLRVFRCCSHDAADHTVLSPSRRAVTPSPLGQAPGEMRNYQRRESPSPLAAQGPIGNSRRWVTERGRPSGSTPEMPSVPLHSKSADDSSIRAVSMQHVPGMSHQGHGVSTDGGSGELAEGGQSAFAAIQLIVSRLM
jgi:hypothetical protein